MADALNGRRSIWLVTTGVRWSGGSPRPVTQTGFARSPRCRRRTRSPCGSPSSHKTPRRPSRTAAPRALGGRGRRSQALGSRRHALGLRKLLSATGLRPEAVEVYVEAMRAHGAMTAALNWYRAMSGDEVAKLPPITTPTLYVWSTGDAALGRTAAEATAVYVKRVLHLCRARRSVTLDTRDAARPPQRSALGPPGQALTPRGSPISPRSPRTRHRCRERPARRRSPCATWPR